MREEYLYSITLKGLEMFEKMRRIKARSGEVLRDYFAVVGFLLHLVVVAYFIGQYYGR
jgi:hypothetical protein